MNSKSTLLDTNVLSELLLANGNPHVAAFVAAQRDLWVSSIVFHELNFGVSLLAEGQRKSRLETGIKAFQIRFQNWVVPVDLSIAVKASQLRAREVKLGFQPDGMDMLIAASAMVRSARLATRNTKDFIRTDLELVNPWTP